MVKNQRFHLNKNLRKMSESDILMLIKKGVLSDELEYQRALSADRTLRLLAKDDPSLKGIRKQLRDLIAHYEKAHWSGENQVTDEQVKESDHLEEIAERERRFIQRRKEVILNRLKNLRLNQKDLGTLLNHNKSYTSELLNGIRAFSSKDLILIHRLLKIRLDDLFPTTVPLETERRVKSSIAKIKTTSKGLTLRETDLQLTSD